MVPGGTPPEATALETLGNAARNSVVSMVRGWLHVYSAVESCRPRSLCLTIHSLNATGLGSIVSAAYQGAMNGFSESDRRSGVTATNRDVLNGTCTVAIYP